MTSPVTARSVVVAGATGLVGTRLVKVLAAAGYDVRAMTRNPDRYHGAGRAVAGDVHDPETLGPAFGGSDIAYYLVHSLDDADFERRDASAAAAFAPLRRRLASERSSTSAASAPRTRSSSRRTGGRGARPRRDWRRPVCPSRCCERRSSSATEGCRGRSPASSSRPAGHGDTALGQDANTADRPE